MPVIEGKSFVGQIGSSIRDREGMYLILSDDHGDVLEIYRTDPDGALTFTAFRGDVPLAAVEWAIQEARQRLPRR